MASTETLEFLRAQLVDDITQSLCVPCTKQKRPINIDDPAVCPCHCEQVEPFLQRLAELDRALWISKTYLTQVKKTS